MLQVITVTMSQMSLFIQSDECWCSRFSDETKAIFIATSAYFTCQQRPLVWEVTVGTRMGAGCYLS